MAVKASTQITISKVIDVYAIYRYYKLQSSTLTKPAKPTKNPPDGWSDTEPAYVSGSTNTLYFVDCNVYSDKSFSFSEVSKSSSYEAAKDAWNKANNAQNTADSANDKIDGLQVGGRNLILSSKGNVKAGFFSDFKVTDEYGEFTLKSKKQYTSISIAKGCLLGARDYIVGEKYVWSYDIMYTAWNFPTGANRTEFWMGQRYTSAPSGTTATGQYRAVTKHDLPVVGSGGCELNKWYHVEKIVTIPEQASDNVNTQASIQFYNSNADVEASFTARIKNVKLEKGNKATDWTPAPEDAIESVSTEYYLSTSATSLSGGSWTATAPTWVNGKYMWSRTVITDGAGNKTYSPSQNGVCIAGAKGDKGDAGKGVRATVVTYQSSTSGTTIPTGEWKSSIPSVAAGSYLWTRTVITYTDNSTSTSYSVGKMGNTGSAGKGIKSTVITYQAHSNGTTAPTGEWTSTVPAATADKPYIWTRTVITYTDNTTSTMYAIGTTPEGVMAQINKVLRYDDTTITLGRTDSALSMNIKNDELNISDGDISLLNIGLTSKEEDGATWDVAYIIADQKLDISSVNDIKMHSRLMEFTTFEGGITFRVDSYQGGSDPIRFDSCTRFSQNYTFNIPSSTNFDCNDFVDSGMYFMGDDTTNRPEKTNGWLEVVNYDVSYSTVNPTSNYVMQTYTTITGKKYTRYKNNGTWGKWGRIWQSYELFANENQAMNTAIGLSDSAANYDMLEIFYKSNDSGQNSTKVYAPNGKKTVLTSTSYVGNSRNLIVKSKYVTIKDSVINTYQDSYDYWTGEATIFDGKSPSSKQADNVGIIRVLGWR